MDKFTQNECDFLLLCKLPNGNIHQLQVSQDSIKQFIFQLDKFEVYEEVVQGLSFEIPKQINNGSNTINPI